MFSEFWKVYPRKQAKAAALKKWQAKKLDAEAQAIVAHVEVRAKKDKQWLNGFIPMPATFLNQERWHDEYESVEPKSAREKQFVELPPPPHMCKWQAACNSFLLTLMVDIGGLMRQVDFDNIILKERDRFVKQMREAYGENIPKDRQEEWFEIRDAWKAQMRDLFKELRSDNPESAVNGLRRTG